MELSQTPQNALFNEEKLAELHQIASGNKDFLKKIAETYVRQFESKFPELRRAVLEHDHEQIEQLAHLLKGASYSVGLDETAARFHRLEMAGEANEIGNLEPTLADIEADMLFFDQEWEANLNKFS
ncbi:Hpt domain-containing protein [Exiguobacterium sp. AM39-5BH]|uniref:Hpt domain-containing protein n=1 Tax=Exiguobacterium sp. AM39-5BH TaxID=2292355 RepID=UPI000FE18DF8|nr:Hpt domain-containing protein [Exiguobacterium sp. AM39-5BH]RHB51913.1 Hpt domain-containing protein [Exiguobacterium sp. AM39-5BH]